MVGKTPQVREIVFNVLDDNGERTVVAKGATTVDVGDTRELFTRTSNLEVLSSNNYSNISNIQSNIVSIETYLSQFVGGNPYSPVLLTLQNDHINNVTRIDTLSTDLAANAVIVDGTYSNVTILQTDTNSNATRLNNLEDYHESNILILNDIFSNVITLQDKQETDFSNISSLQGQIESVTNFGDITDLQSNVNDLMNRVAFQSIRIGEESGGGSTSLNTALAIGYQSGRYMGNHSIAIGTLANYNSGLQQQSDTQGSIVINATGTGPIVAPRRNTLVITPIQEDNSNVINIMGSNVQTNEITRTSLLRLKDSNVHVSTNVSIANDTILLRPDGNGSFGGNIDINQTLDVGGTSSFGGVMTLNNDLETIGTSSFGGDMTVDSNVFVDGQSFIVKNGPSVNRVILREDGTGSFYSNVRINASSDTSTGNPALEVAGASTFKSHVKMGGAGTDNLEVIGTSSFGGDMTMNSNLAMTNGSFSMDDGTGDKILLQTNGVSSFHGMITTHGGINVTSGTVDIYHPAAQLRVGTADNDYNAIIDQDGTSSFSGAMTVNNTLTVTNYRTTLNGGLTIPTGQTGSFLGATEFESTSSFGGAMTVNNDINQMGGSFSMFGDGGTTKNVEILRDGTGSFNGTLSASAIKCTGDDGNVEIYNTANANLKVGTGTNNFNAVIDKDGNGSFKRTMTIEGNGQTEALIIAGDTSWRDGQTERCRLEVGDSTNNSKLEIRGSLEILNDTQTNASISSIGEAVFNGGLTCSTFTQIGTQGFNFGIGNIQTTGTLTAGNTTLGTLSASTTTLGGTLKIDGDHYIRLNAGSSQTDYCDIKQVGGNNAYKLIFDFRDDGNDLEFALRSNNIEKHTWNEGNYTASGNITSSGTITASTDVVVSSDERLKTDITQISDAIQKVKQIRGCTYTMDDKPSAGVIAQELIKVLPESVHTKEDGYYGVSYHGIIALLIEAVKELSEKIK